jgi:hypothetical protein
MGLPSGARPMPSPHAGQGAVTIRSCAVRTRARGFSGELTPADPESRAWPYREMATAGCHRTRSMSVKRGSRTIAGTRRGFKGRGDTGPAAGSARQRTTDRHPTGWRRRARVSLDTAPHLRQAARCQGVAATRSARPPAQRRGRSEGRIQWMCSSRPIIVLIVEAAQSDRQADDVCDNLREHGQRVQPHRRAARAKGLM